MTFVRTRAALLALALLVFPFSANSSVSAQDPVPDLSELKAHLHAERIAPISVAPAPERDTSGFPFAPRIQTNADQALSDSRIVFQSFRDDNWDVYRANSAFSSFSNATQHSASDIRPELSFNGQKIVFSSNRTGNFEIFVMNWDGSGLQQLTFAPGIDTSPSFAPDGRIAFVTDRDGNFEVYVMNGDGSGLRRLTYTPEPEYGPSWSVMGQMSWGKAIPNSPMGVAVYTTQALLPADLLTLPYLGSPVWSHDGRRLLLDGDVNNDYFNELVTVDLGTNRATAIYKPAGQYVDAWAGSWSPDDASVLFTRVEYRLDGNRLVKSSAYIESVSASGGIATRRTGTGRDEQPIWNWVDTSPPGYSLMPLPTHSRVGKITIGHSGVDTGPAGIAGYEVEIDADNSGGWMKQLVWSNRLQVAAPIDALVRVRGKSIDRAGNSSGMSSTATTQMYTWLLNGAVTDNRGTLLPRVTVTNSLSLTQTTSTGSFLFFKNRYSSTQIHAAKAGYGDVNRAATYHDVTDIHMDSIYLAPADNLLSNGEFESYLSGWQASPTVPPTSAVTIQYAHNADGAVYGGGASLSLQSGCTLPCFGSLQTFTDEGNLILETTPAIPMVDSGGTMHVFYTSYYTEIRHVTRLGDGSWSPPITVTAEIANGSYPVPLYATADASGNLHLIYSVTGGLRHIRRNTSGIWSAPITIVSNQNFLAGKLRALANGELTLATCYSGELAYLRTGASGVWQPLVMTGQVCRDVAVDAQGALHVITQDQTGAFIYRRLDTNGNWSLAETIATGALQSSTAQIAVDTSNQPHTVFARDASHVAYSRRNQNGWTTPESIPGFSSVRTLYIDSAGMPHATELSAIHPQNTYRYATRAAGGVWSEPAEVIGKWVVFADANAPFVFGATGYQTPIAVADHISASVRYVTAIPAPMINPTLAFAYRLNVSRTPGTTILRATVQSSDLSLSHVLTQSTAQAWRTAWFDVSDLAGQTVTVTFELRQAMTGTAILAQADLDHVTLGSSVTPQPASIMPTHVPKITGATQITITGRNFMPGAQVFLGEQPLSGVTVVSSTQLIATLPINLQLGRQTVLVRNIDGYEGTLVDGLAVGTSVLLPMALW